MPAAPLLTSARSGVKMDDAQRRYAVAKRYVHDTITMQLSGDYEHASSLINDLLRNETLAASGMVALVNACSAVVEVCSRDSGVSPMQLWQTHMAGEVWRESS
jgi:hypothetical protein